MNSCFTAAGSNNVHIMTSPPEKIRLLIADDQPVILRGLSIMLDSEDDIEVIGQANDGVEAVELAMDLNPDVVIMDLKMPTLNGIEATQNILRNNPDIKIIVLSTFATDELLAEAIESGAFAYLLKDTEEQNVITMVRAAYQGIAAPSSEAFWQRPELNREH